MTRNTYDTSIKHLYRFGLHKSIPEDLRKMIPKTNINRWKNEKESKYIGFHLNEIAKEELDVLKAFSDAKRAKQIFRASIRITKTLQSILNTREIERVICSKKEKIVNLAYQVKDTFSINEFIKIIGISRSTFQNWQREIHAKCDNSFIFLCNQRFPLQASRLEIITLKKMLTSSEYKFWPIASIAAFCRREKILFLSDASWYKYGKLLGITRPKPESRRKKKKTGVRATAPNEKWHADASVFKIGNVKHYIYLVADNFSRRILSWRVSHQLNAAIRVQTIREAYQKATLMDTDLNVDLIVDGGSENNNSTMDNFIKASEINIQKLVALRDIHFSNSLIEAHFSLIKYNYLYRMKINSLSNLRDAMTFVEHDFNTIRPHGSLNGSTPNDAYFSGELMQKNTFQTQFIDARSIRISENKKNICMKCD
jgi:putative transposase